MGHDTTQSATDYSRSYANLLWNKHCENKLVKLCRLDEFHALSDKVRIVLVVCKVARFKHLSSLGAK